MLPSPVERRLRTQITPAGAALSPLAVVSSDRRARARDTAPVCRCVLAKKLDMDDSEVIAPVTPGFADEQRVAASVLATQTPPHDRLFTWNVIISRSAFVRSSW